MGDITSDVYNGSFSIAAPYLSTNVQTIDYGRIPITEVQTTEVQLQNSGSAQLVIDELVYNTDILSFPLQLPLNIEVGTSTSENLVFTPDVLGLYDAFTPKFVRKFANLQDDIGGAAADYRAAVIDGSFPTKDHLFWPKKT